MLAAERMVRSERAVRPCFPMTLPTSFGETNKRRTVASFSSSTSIRTASESSTRARATSVINAFISLTPFTFGVSPTSLTQTPLKGIAPFRFIFPKWESFGEQQKVFSFPGAACPPTISSFRCSSERIVCLVGPRRTMLSKRRIREENVNGWNSLGTKAALRVTTH